MAAQLFKTGSFIAKSEFARDDRGSVAVIFGLMLLAFLMVAGVAIDYGRLHHTKSRLVSAADAAALVGGSVECGRGLSGHHPQKNGSPLWRHRHPDYG